MPVMAASTDSREDAEKMKSRHDISFPIGFGLEVEDIAEKTGAFYDEEHGYLHAAGFLLDPEGKVAQSVFASGGIGRFQPDDVLAMSKTLMKKQSA